MFFQSALKQQITELQQQLATQEQQHQQQIALLQQNFERQLATERSSQSRQHQAISVCATMLQGGVMLQQIRQDMANDAGMLANEQQALVALKQMFSQTEQAIGQLDRRAAQITTDAQQSAQLTANLEQTAKSINQLIAAIQEISDQTNLLALNAAIEAARAGEAGRGFAVVADEVRQLAGKAHSASDQIEELIRRIISQTGDMQAMVSQSQLSAADVASSSAQINQVVQTVIERSGHMQQVIGHSSATAFLNTVKLDHAVWKHQVYDMIQQQKFAETVNAHSECRLGKWYFEGEGRQLYSHLRSFQQLDQPHKLVHESGRAALRAGLAGNDSLMLQALQQMEQASQQVTDLLTQLQQDIRQ